MIISTKARYGVLAMVVLAKNYSQQQPLSIKSIAANQQISEQYLEQIFSLLKKSELVKSTRGQKGGYALTKKPELISIGEIIRVLEGPLAPTDCVNNADGCAKIEFCSAASIWKSIYDDINEVVDSYCLTDMIKDSDRIG